MKDFVESVFIWRLAITRITLFCFVAGATTFCTTMSGLEWSALTGTQRVITLLGVTVAMASNAIAFLDKTISRVAEGKPPVEVEPEKIKLP